MDTLQERIAGEIALSDSPGSTMKKWRELFGISQVELSKFLKISTSTISDYEGNRRASPGVGIIKRFVNSLFSIDVARGGEVIRNLEKYSLPQGKDPFYLIHDFAAPISGTDFARIIDAKIISNPNTLDTVKIFGYTLIDSIRVILEISPSEYPKLFGTTNERAFSIRPGEHRKVSDGRDKGCTDKAKDSGHTERCGHGQACHKDSSDREDTPSEHQAHNGRDKGQAEQRINQIFIRCALQRQVLNK